LGHQAAQIRGYGLPYFARWASLRFGLWVSNRINERFYTRLTPAQLSARRRSDTVFVFGSGYSLNDVAPQAWREFAAHDTFGFSGFVYQQWIRTDFHLVRSWDAIGTETVSRGLRSARAYARLLEENPRFRDAAYILQGDFGAMFANTLVGHRLLPLGAPLARFSTARRLDTLPSRRWKDGVNHGPGALADVVNVVYLLGWKRIVLVGVDLYDNRYFWGPPDATVDFDDAGECRRPALITDRGADWRDSHLMVKRGIVDIMGQWGRLFAGEGVALSVYNPRSLLAQVLPVYDGPGNIRDVGGTSRSSA
jgi:hypothetical protein